MGRKKKRRQKPAALEIGPEDGPTPERLLRAGGDYEYGERGNRDRRAMVLTMHDNPINRALRREKIDLNQWMAADRYRELWSRAGMAGTLRSPDHNWVRAGNLEFGHMARSEIEADSRRRYREAVQVLGMRSSRTLELVVCLEHPMEFAGYQLGYRGRASAIVGGTERVRAALDQLCTLWKIGGR